MLNRMKLGTKLTVAFALVALVAVAVGLMSIRTMNVMRIQEDDIYTVHLTSIEALGAINEAQMAIQAAQYRLADSAVFKSQKARKDSFAMIEEKWAAIDEHWKIYESMSKEDDEEKVWSELRPVFEAWKNTSQAIVSIAKEKEELLVAGVAADDARIININNRITKAALEGDEAFAKTEVHLEKTVDVLSAGAKDADAKFDAGAHSAKTLMLIVLAGGLLLTVALAIYFITNLNGIIRSLLDETGKLSQAAVGGQLATRGNPDKVNFEFRGIIEGVNDTLDAVIGPLNVAAEYIDRIGAGDIPPRITDNYNGDFNEIKNNLNKCIDSLGGLIEEMNHMSSEHDAGDIDVVIAEGKFQGAYHTMAKGVNNMVNGHIAVKKKAMACVKEFGEGNFEAPLDKFPGKKVFINDTIEQVRVNLRALVEDANMLSKAAVDGKLATRADASRHQGDFRKIVQGVNDTLDAVIGPLNVAAEYIDRISNGDIPERITDNYNGDFNEIKNNLNKCLEALSGLISDMNHMSREHDAGDIDVIMNADKFQGAYKEMAQGVNNMVNGHIAVKKKAMACINEFGKGNFEATLERFPGKKAFINENIEGLRENLKALVVDANMLSDAAVDGKLATRADASRHQGDFRKIVQGVNNTLDAVIGPLNVAAEYIDRISNGDIPERIVDNYNGDFNEIKNNLNKCLEALSGLITDMNHMSREHDAGDIDVMMNADKFQGAYKNMAAGVNTMVGGHIAVKKKAMAVFSEFGNGNFEAPMEKLPGKKVFINETIEQVRANLKALIADAVMLSQAARDGKLATRADATKHKGDFRKIVEGVNDTLDSVIGPLNVAAEYVDRISNGDIPAKITDNYNGDFNEIKNNLNKCIDALSGLITDMNHMSREHDAGDIDVVMDVEKFEGAYKKMAGGVNTMVGGHIAVKKKAMGVFSEFGKGNIDAEMEKLPGKKVFINETIEQVRANLKGLINEMNHMSREHDAGDIDVVMNVGMFQGAYKAMAEGVNGMVNGHIAVKKKAMACVAEFGRGNFDAPLEKFPGKKVFINETIEQVRENLKALGEDANMLVKAALEGKLATRADASKHMGDFQKIVQGVNDTLDAVILPVNEAAEILNYVAKNDMTKLVTGDYKGDHAKIKESLNTAVGNLNNVLSQVVESVAQVGSASQQISSSAQGVAEGTSEQASSLEEISSSLEEMSGMTKRNAENAAQAQNLSKSANDSAEKGKIAMQRMNAAIEDIKNSSDKTAKIVKTIDEIAFQTNLLALNAAVEAARAGEAGKGFAVVAEEVRNLAMRSAEAAKETAKMIEESVKNSDNGVKIADEVGKSLLEIADGAGKVNNLVAEIAAASREQAQGIDQVNIAMGQMDKVTQANASAAEESASAAEELSAQSTQLADVVAAFSISRTGNGSSRSISSDTLYTGDVSLVKQAAQQKAQRRAEMSRSQKELVGVGAGKKRGAGSASGGNGGNGGNGKKKPEIVIPMDDEDYSNF